MLNFEPLERLGRIVTTSKAKAKVPRNEIATALLRHARSVSENASESAGRYVKRTSFEGCRLLTVYRTSNGTDFWIISEPSERLTRVMLPEDY